MLLGCLSFQGKMQAGVAKVNWLAAWPIMAEFADLSPCAVICTALDAPAPRGPESQTMKRPTRIKMLVCTLAAALLAGCGLTVHQRAALLDFNRAATEFSSVTANEFQYTRDDVIKLNIYRDKLGDASLDPDRMDGNFSPDRLKIRLQAMAALQSYANLLQKLVTGSQEDELQSASDLLITNLRQVKGVSLGDNQAGAIAKAVASVAGLWVEHKRKQATCEVVKQADAPIKSLLATVEREFRLDSSTNWVAGYRATAITLMGRAAFLENRDTNAPLAALANLREARAYARTVTNRIDTVSSTIISAAHSLTAAQDKLYSALTSADIRTADITAFAAQVDDFVMLYKAITTK
jgi:hypothetical protein